MNPLTHEALIDWVISGSLRLPDRSTITPEELELLTKMEDENTRFLLNGVIPSAKRREALKSMLEGE